MLGKRIVSLRKQNHLTQEELSSALGISRSALSLYEIDKRQPDIDMLKKLASFFAVSIDFLLGENTDTNITMNELLGYNGEDESAVSFAQKLANQIDFNNTKLSDLAIEIGVSEQTILDWLSGENKDYTKFLSNLSKFFKVQMRYWTSPNSISPGIEPNSDEYLLILLYREYNKSGFFNEYYGSLEQYFPGITVVDNSIDNKFLSIFRQLNEDNKDIIIGEIKKFLKEQRNEKSVDSDNQPGKSLA